MNINSRRNQISSTMVQIASLSTIFKGSQLEPTEAQIIPQSGRGSSLWVSEMRLPVFICLMPTYASRLAGSPTVMEREVRP